MNVDKTALVLEGGGMRGIYTSGVLDTFLKHNIHFPYIIGVSAGVAFGVSYKSKQIGRNIDVHTKYVRDPRYMGVTNLIKNGNYFNWDFVFGEVPDRLVPFDYDTFFSDAGKFVIVATNCKTGKAEYIDARGLSKQELKVVMTASSSMPFAGPMVKYRDNLYLDGGISDSIPFEKALRDDNDKVVVVLTRNAGYKKENFKLPIVIRTKYRSYPALVGALLSRANEYNHSLERLYALEAEGKAFIIRPKTPIIVSRVERDVRKLKEQYENALKETEEIIPSLQEWLGY